MDFGRGFIGTSVSDHGLADDERRPDGLFLSLAEGSVDGGDIVAVDGSDDVPVVGLEAAGHILAEGEVSCPLDLDVVVVVEVDELAQS